MTGGRPEGPLVTVDAVVTDDRGAVLLIKRRNPPEGWALPGGFVDLGESCESAVVRELAEETGLEASSVEQFRVYSDPSRDPRGPTVAVVFRVEARGELQAGDDAAEAQFFPLDALPNPIAFDHAQIIRDALGQ